MITVVAESLSFQVYFLGMVGLFSVGKGRKLISATVPETVLERFNSSSNAAHIRILLFGEYCRLIWCCVGGQHIAFLGF